MRGLERRMEAVRRAVELGRAARAAAGMKVRQPLAKAVIVAQGAEREAIESMGDLVRGRAERQGAGVRLRRGGAGLLRGEAELPHARPAVRQADAPGRGGGRARSTPSHAAEAIRGERRIGINLDGHDHELAPDDITLVMQPLDGYEVEAEAGRAVALALELDDGLLREGLAREVVHAVQAARKDAGLEVTDRISLTLGGDEGLLEAAREHEAYVAGETLATSVGYDGGGGAGAVTIEGRALEIAVERAS